MLSCPLVAWRPTGKRRPGTGRTGCRGDPGMQKTKKSWCIVMCAPGNVCSIPVVFWHHQVAPTDSFTCILTHSPAAVTGSQAQFTPASWITERRWCKQEVFTILELFSHGCIKSLQSVVKKADKQGETSLPRNVCLVTDDFAWQMTRLACHIPVSSHFPIFSFCSIFNFATSAVFFSLSSPFMFSLSSNVF